MATPTEYREIAEECLEAMRATTSPEVRAELLRLSLQWQGLADEAERRHRPWGTDEQTSAAFSIRRQAEKYLRVLKNGH
jgi:hypothetical protein